MPEEVKRVVLEGGTEFANTSAWEHLAGSPRERFLAFHPEDHIPKDRFGKMAANHEQGKALGFADMMLLPKELFDFAFSQPPGIEDEAWLAMIGRWMINGKTMLPKSRELLAEKFEEYTNNGGKWLAQAA